MHVPLPKFFAVNKSVISKPSMKKLHYLSLTTAPVQVCDAQGTPLSNATSFFYETTDSQLFLITNWHVVTGRNPSNPSDSKTSVVPCFVKIKVHKKQEKVGGLKNIIVSDISEVCIRINSEDGNDPKWLEHPKYKLNVDVVGINLGSYLEFRETLTFNAVNKWKEYLEDYEPEVMDDVFVIGYPWGLSSTAERGGGLPVYKKGCIASDPIVDYRRLPCVLIDCQTTSAMSGSPVLSSHSGIFMPDGKLSGNSVLGTVTKLLGVYSGRLYGNDLVKGFEDKVSEIGVVWKASVLETITQHGIPGTSLRSLAR